MVQDALEDFTRAIPKRAQSVHHQMVAMCAGSNVFGTINTAVRS